MARPWPLVLAVSLAVGLSISPAPTQPSARATTVAHESGPAAAAEHLGAPLPHPAGPPTTAADADIVPGSVGRSSPFLDATYQTDLGITWGARTIRVDSTATVRNTSGGPIDRIEFNTIAARLGSMRFGAVTVDGHAVAATVSGQTIVVPLGGILPVDGTTRVRIAFRATLRSGLAGSSWMFTRTNGIADLYRWLPWVSRRITFDRPNHGDPFETPTSRLVEVRIHANRPLKLATTGDRRTISRDRLVQTFVARDVRDFTVTAALDYRTRERVVAGTTIRLYYRPGAPAGAMLDAAADAFGALRSRLGAYPYSTFKVVQSAGGYGMESPRLIWIPTGVARSNLRYLAAHETAHQWFYGLVGNDQSAEPFADEAAADFAARFVLGQKRSSRCGTTRLDRSIYDYSAACYYEVIYIQGGNLLDRARVAMGSTAFWSALRGYVAANRHRLVGTSTLLDTLDAATPIDLGATLFGPRFPRLY
jgi:hypothetical protein